MDQPAALKQKALNASLWSGIDKFSQQIVQFIVSVILTRLLEPKDYGLIAITVIFTTVSSAITDGGFEKAIIHQQQLTNRQLSTIFYVNCLLGAFMTLIFVVTAPMIAAFFNEPELIAVLRVISLSIFINALGQIQSILLRKELIFKKTAYAQMISSIVGGIVGIVLAYNHYGVWALVYTVLSSQLVMVACYWYDAIWYPTLEFSYASIKGFLPYGLNILFSSVVGYFIQQFNNFVVGKFYTKAELGLFSRGSKFPEMITSLLEGIMIKISFPLFAKLQFDEDRLKSALKKTIKGTAFVCFPLLTVLLVNARDITVFLFTEKWIDSVIFLQLFCLVRILHPFVTLYREMILAKGKAKLLSVVLIASSSFEIIAILLAIRFGIIYIIMVSLASIVLQYIVYTVLASRQIHMPYVEHLIWLRPYFLASAVAAAGMYGVSLLTAGTSIVLFLKICASVFTGLSLYAITALAYFRVEEREYLKTATVFVYNHRLNPFRRNSDNKIQQER